MDSVEQGKTNRTDNGSLHVCHHCDYLLEIPELKRGEKAHCPRCSTLLKTGNKVSVEVSLALAWTAITLLVLSVPFPFMGFRSGGPEQVISLYSGLSEIFSNDRPFLAIITFSMILVVPFLVLVSGLFLFGKACSGNCKDTFKMHLRIVYYGGNWAMAEVFIVGILVSLTKITSMATVLLGPSFYFYCGFVVVFTIFMKSLNREKLWDLWEHKGGSLAG